MKKIKYIITSHIREGAFFRFFVATFDYQALSPTKTIFYPVFFVEMALFFVGIDLFFVGTLIFNYLAKFAEIWKFRIDCSNLRAHATHLPTCSPEAREAFRPFPSDERPFHSDKRTLSPYPLRRPPPSDVL